MKKFLVVFFLFPAISNINAQTEVNSSKDAVAEKSEVSNSHYISKSKHHVYETTYYAYADQVYTKINQAPLNGVVYEKWRNGMMWWETSYKNGLKNGLNREWYKSGQLYTEAIYKDGKLMSQKCWDEEGVEFECD